VQINKKIKSCFAISAFPGTIHENYVFFSRHKIFSIFSVGPNNNLHLLLASLRKKYETNCVASSLSNGIMFKINFCFLSLHHYLLYLLMLFFLLFIFISLKICLLNKMSLCRKINIDWLA